MRRFRIATPAKAEFTVRVLRIALSEQEFSVVYTNRVPHTEPAHCVLKVIAILHAVVPRGPEPYVHEVSESRSLS